MKQTLEYCTGNPLICAALIVFLSTASSIFWMTDNPLTRWLDGLIW